MLFYTIFNRIRKKKYLLFKNLNFKYSAWAGAEIYIEVVQIKMQDSWSSFYQQAMEEESLFRWNYWTFIEIIQPYEIMNLYFLPHRSQWMKNAFSNHLKTCLITILCRDVTNIVDGSPVTAVMSLCPPSTACLHLLVFVLFACKLSGVSLYFCSV